MISGPQSGLRPIFLSDRLHEWATRLLWREPVRRDCRSIRRAGRRTNRLNREQLSLALLLLTLAKTRAEPHNKPFHRKLKRIADSKERKHRARAASLNHLPVAHTESIRNHIFLAELPFGSKGSDAMAQCAEEALIFRREFSTGTHYLRLESWRAKAPRTKLRILEGNAGPWACRGAGDSAQGNC
jgi:hypothetical protein